MLTLRDIATMKNQEIKLLGVILEQIQCLQRNNAIFNAIKMNNAEQWFTVQLRINVGKNLLTAQHILMQHVTPTLKLNVKIKNLNLLKLNLNLSHQLNAILLLLKVTLSFMILILKSQLQKLANFFVIRTQTVNQLFIAPVMTFAGQKVPISPLLKEVLLIHI